MKEYIKYWDEELVEQHVGQDIGYVTNYFKELNVDTISFIDIGANVGKIYDCLKKTFTIEKCIMVEANKNLSDYIKDKYKNETNIEIHNIGISNENGKFKVYEAGFENLTEFTRSINLGLSRVEKEEGDTECFTMDHFLRNINTLPPNKISLIKIDTETKDYIILKDMMKWLHENNIQPYILFENNYFFCMTKEEAQIILDDFCSLCNYEPLVVENLPGDCFLKPILRK
jgi:FkbM family methyltransferase